jgi:hypothetical protein
MFSFSIDVSARDSREDDDSEDEEEAIFWGRTLRNEVIHCRLSCSSLACNVCDWPCDPSRNATLNWCLPERREKLYKKQGML